MRDFLYYLCRMDFMQGMLLASVFFILPLKHRKSWQWHMFLIVSFSLALGVVETIWYIGYGRNNVVLFFYYLSPIVASYILFWRCSVVPMKDALYGLSCIYIVQHIAFCLTVIIWGEHKSGVRLTVWQALGEWLVHLVIFILCYFLVARYLPVRGEYQVNHRKALITFFMVLLVSLGLNYVVRQLKENADPMVYSICMAYDLLSCVFLLWLQVEQRRETELMVAMESERRIQQQMQEQYETSRVNIDMINQKCHDMKHQISALRLMGDPKAQDISLREMEESVMIYDAMLRTGNKVLDVVLTEKSLICERNKISWTCMADGQLLDFISPVDLYTIFGNALDNAIESSQTIHNIEQRTVTVTIQKRSGGIFIQVANYYDHPIYLVQGVPQSTKKDAENHGYGIRSIHSIVERYGGTMDIQTQGGIFLLNILIPLPSLDEIQVKSRQN